MVIITVYFEWTNVIYFDIALNIQDTLLKERSNVAASHTRVQWKKESVAVVLTMFENVDEEVFVTYNSMPTILSLTKYDCGNTKCQPISLTYYWLKPSRNRKRSSIYWKFKILRDFLMTLLSKRFPPLHRNMTNIYKFQNTALIWILFIKYYF